MGYLNIRKNIWLIVYWVYILMANLNLINWSFSKKFITNQDLKFMSKFKTAIFIKLEVKSLDNIVYHL